MNLAGFGEDPPRVAFFPDTYHEVDGVANTSRQYEAFAIRRGLPFLTIFGGTENRVEIDGSGTRVELRRGLIGFALDKKHTFDLTFCRHYKSAEAAVRDFNPDIIHITGPSDVGILGALIADRLRIPLAASWHTNLHQYADERLTGLLAWAPERVKSGLGTAVGASTLRAVLRFYKMAQILFAPNQELIGLVEQSTGKPCYLMQRGVDTALFNPERRERSSGSFVIGYVGRLTTEKNIRLLAEIEAALSKTTLTDYRFLIVGQGAEEPWLRAHMTKADFPGVLKGEALAKAYANMDVFVFPSRTDTFGNVVLEALASGVPALVTASGGPRFIVRAGETGFVAQDVQEFVRGIQQLALAPELLQRMRSSARAYANSASWDSVFEAVYAGYERGLRSSSAAGKKIRLRSSSRVYAGPQPG